MAASSCGSNGCTGITPTYTISTHTSNGAVEIGGPVSSTYGDGSGWQGTVYTDTVTLGNVVLPAMAIAIITEASSFFNENCNQVTPPLNQGIMGYGIIRCQF